MTTKNAVTSNIIERDWQRASPSGTSGPASNLVPLDNWRAQIGRTNATIWRWRKRGWLQVINIAGRLYLSRDEIKRFEARVLAGEFSQPHKTPKRKAANQ
jgi:hypothetical protein